MRIAVLLGRLFNLRSGEWRRLSILYVMSLVVLTACNWADAIVQGAFLQRVGVQYLPWVIISSAACSVVALFIYTAFADRVSNTRLLIGILAVSGAGILLGLAALAAGLVGPAYLLLFVVLQVPLLDVYNVHWATYVNGFYDIRTAKRIVPVLSTSARLAGIIGGLSMPLMNRLFSPAAIIAASLLSLAVMAALAVGMPRWLGKKDTGTRRRGDTATSPPRLPVSASLRLPLSPSPRPVGLRARVSRFARAYGANLREGYRQIARSSFLRWMAVSTLSMTLLMTMLNYGASAIFQEQLKTTVAISDFLGVLSGVANLVVLPFQLLLLSRLITRLGLGNASLVYPLATLASAGSLAVAPGLGTAALAYVDRTALRTAFRIPTDNLLYNAVPQRVKARTRAFVGGLVVPIGAILGGLLLLTPLMRTPWFLPAGMLVLGVAFTLAALMVRRHYGPALVDLLEQEDYSSLALQAPSLQAPSAFAAADPATLARLAQKLNESTSPERAIFMAQLITAVGGEAAVPIVGQAARAAPDGRLRASLIDVLAAADVRGGAVRSLYAELLADSDGQVRLSAISGLEQLDGPRDARYLELAARLLADPETEVRLRAAGALAAADDPDRRAAGTAELRALLNAPDPRTRARALGVVGRVPPGAAKTGQAPASELLPEVVHSLADGADEVRLAAALAVESWVDSELPDGSRETLRTAVPALLHDPIERARVAAATILGRLSVDGGADAAAVRERLVEALADPSPEVRELAIEVLASAGQQAVPEVREQLEAADPNLRKMAAVVLARIEPRRYAPLVRGPILDGNLRTIYRNLGCLQALAGCPGPAVAVLERALRERNGIQLDEVFYLLATIRDPAAVKTIAQSLRSPQPEVRANATEALESLTAPQTAALIGPLFEPDLPPGQLGSLARQTWDISIPTPAAALRLLGSQSDGGDAWERTLAAAALAELSASVDPESDGEIAELLSLAQVDTDAGVRAEVLAAAALTRVADGQEAQGDRALSTVKKVIALVEVPFFQGMTVEQLRVLADVCEEELFPAGARLFVESDSGGVLYVVVSGRVGIEQQKRPGSFARLATVEAGSYLGETDFFDENRRSNSAIAIQDTRTLRLRREPLIALARQHPDLSLELINVLGVRLREATDRIADLTRTHPRELHKLFDQLA
jgi:HEAT repeat protein